MIIIIIIGKEAEICWDEKRKATQQLKQIIQLEKRNEKVPVKERILKYFETGSNKRDKTGYSKTTKVYRTRKYEENAKKHTNNWMTRQQNDFRATYRKEENIKKAE